MPDDGLLQVPHMTFSVALYVLIRSLVIMLFVAWLLKWLAVACLGISVLIWKNSKI